MSTPEEKALALFVDGLAASVRALISEMASGPEEKEFRQRLALAAAADVKSKTVGPQQEAARNVTLTIVARTFGVSFGSIGGQ